MPPPHRRNRELGRTDARLAYLRTRLIRQARQDEDQARRLLLRLEGVGLRIGAPGIVDAVVTLRGALHGIWDVAASGEGLRGDDNDR